MSERAKPMVGDQHLTAWVSETLQAAGACQEDPICGLIIESAVIARGEEPNRDFLASLVEWATSHYAAALAASQQDGQIANDDGTVVATRTFGGVRYVRAEDFKDAYDRLAALQADRGAE